MLEPVTLSREDWAEIYYALDSKRLAVKNGEYGPEIEAGETNRWTAHLDGIIEKIGPDGEDAADNGVYSA